MSEAFGKGWTERRRSVYEADNAQDFADWLNKHLAELPQGARVTAIMCSLPLADGGFMIGIRHANVG